MEQTPTPNAFLSSISWKLPNKMPPKAAVRKTNHRDVWNRTCIFEPLVSSALQKYVGETAGVCSAEIREIKRGGYARGWGLVRTQKPLPQIKHGKASLEHQTDSREIVQATPGSLVLPPTDPQKSQPPGFRVALLWGAGRITPTKFSRAQFCHCI